MTRKHIVLTTWGSLGDLHPFLALAIEMQKRGHRATIATSESYRAKVESTGVGFHAVRPDLPTPELIQSVMQRVMDSSRGTEFLFRHLLMPALRESFEDLSVLAPTCDLWLTHPAQMAGPIVAQKFGLRWVSCILAPICLYSIYDPPILPHPIFPMLYRLGKTGRRFASFLVHKATADWFGEVGKLRREIGLPAGAHPMFEGQYSPQCNLALFSSALGEPQPDWPQNTAQPGFVFYDTRGDLPWKLDVGLPTENRGVQNGALSPALARFLEDGEAPLVFTLGSAAVNRPGEFFRESAQAARLLNRRALLLGDTKNCGGDSPDIASFDYAPYSEVFPRACAIVHQGGVGTTAQALRAGKPQLVVPQSHDQPDNASRIVRRKIGKTMPLTQYQAQRIAQELRPLLDNIEYSKRAAQIGLQVQRENGTSQAADVLEAQLHRSS